MNKKIALFIMLIAVIILAGCQKISPESTVDNFFKSARNLEIKKASEMLTADLAQAYEEMLKENEDFLGNEDDEEITFDEMKELEIYKEVETEFKKLAGKLKHKIVDTKIDDDNAEIEVEVTYADASEPLIQAIGEMFGKMIGLAFSGTEPTEEDIINLAFETIDKSLKNSEIETATTSGVILLVKSDKQWLIKEFDENIVNALLFGLGDFDDFDLFGGELEIDLDFDDFEVNDGNQ
jgi:hypothetical protein